MKSEVTNVKVNCNKSFNNERNTKMSDKMRNEEMAIEETLEEEIEEILEEETEKEMILDEETILALEAKIEDQEQTILDLTVKLEAASNGSGRKSQVLGLLQDSDAISILDLSRKIGISTKNVSSQLTYLRTDGYKIFTDNNGKKVLMD